MFALLLAVLLTPTARHVMWLMDDYVVPLVQLPMFFITLSRLALLPPNAVKYLLFVLLVSFMMVPAANPVA